MRKGKEYDVQGGANQTAISKVVAKLFRGIRLQNLFTKNQFFRAIFFL